MGEQFSLAEGNTRPEKQGYVHRLWEQGLGTKVVHYQEAEKIRDYQNRLQSTSFTMSIHCAGVKAIPKVTEKMKHAELEITASICCHGAIMAVDHLGEVCSVFTYTTELYEQQSRKEVPKCQNDEPDGVIYCYIYVCVYIYIYILFFFQMCYVMCNC